MKNLVSGDKTKPHKHFGLCVGKSLQLALCIVLLVTPLTSDVVEEDKVTKTNNCMVIVKKGRLSS